jgi:DNA-binding response OmpR family regulator
MMVDAKRILIVDDDIEILRQLGAAFTAAGYEVHAATDGAIAMTRFAAVRPDIVLMDILMPTREGLETIMAMRRAGAAVKIIAMSGGGRIGPDEFLTLAHHLGADAVMAKPFRLSDMVAVAGRTLQAPRGETAEALITAWQAAAAAPEELEEPQVRAA